MVVIDVNVLIAAFDQAHSHHSRAQPWLEQRLGDPTEQVIVPDLVWVGFVRIITNSAVYPNPATLAAAANFVRAVQAAPGYGEIPARRGAVGRFLNLATENETPSRHVTDAYIASVARHLDCPLATFDKGLRRFESLDVIAPGAD